MEPGRADADRFDGQVEEEGGRLRLGGRPGLQPEGQSQEGRVQDGSPLVEPAPQDGFVAVDPVQGPVEGGHDRPRCRRCRRGYRGCGVGCGRDCRRRRAPPSFLPFPVVGDGLGEKVDGLLVRVIGYGAVFVFRAFFLIGAGHRSRGIVFVFVGSVVGIGAVDDPSEVTEAVDRTSPVGRR